eukprot:12406639-Alexandrium_andersonii.AAC.1
MVVTGVKREHRNTLQARAVEGTEAEGWTARSPWDFDGEDGVDAYLKREEDAEDAEMEEEGAVAASASKRLRDAQGTARP